MRELINRELLFFKSYHVDIINYSELMRELINRELPFFKSYYVDIKETKCAF